MTIAIGKNGPSEQEITKSVIAAGYKVSSVSVVYDTGAAFREILYLLKWRSTVREIEPPPFVAGLAAEPHTVRVALKPEPQNAP